MHPNYVKTDSYVSLVDREEVQTNDILLNEDKKVPSYVFGVDNNGVYLRADNSVWGENLFVERCIDNSIVTNRYDTMLLKLECVGKNSSLYLITLDTSHHAFSQTKSRTVRSLRSFYYLHKTLKKLHPYVSVPSLPLKPILWMSSYQSRLDVLSSFLAGLLSCQELLSDKALHLFLQSDISTDQIQQNLDGLRDDEIHESKNQKFWNMFKKRRCNSVIVNG